MIHLPDGTYYYNRVQVHGRSTPIMATFAGGHLTHLAEHGNRVPAVWYPQYAPGIAKEIRDQVALDRIFGGDNCIVFEPLNEGAELLVMDGGAA